MMYFLFPTPSMAEPVKKPECCRPLSIVVSFSILADAVQQVGGESVAVYSLVPPGSDAHMFEPTPADAQRIKKADLVFVSGLGFEGWMTRLIESSGYVGRVIDLSRGINPLILKDGTPDPHAWQDVSNMLVYAENIRAAMVTLFPEWREQYNTNTAKYSAQLKALDLEIRNTMDKIPADKRKVITSHDAFGYYARAYGVTFLAPLGMSTDSEPSAQGIARLIDQIRAEKINALFVENISNKRLIEQLEADSGARLGGTLYSDALSGKDGSAMTYIDMMRHNTDLLASAMAQGAEKK